VETNASLLPIHTQSIGKEEKEGRRWRRRELKIIRGKEMRWSRIKEKSRQ
jgi:hypothetical protein